MTKVHRQIIDRPSVLVNPPKEDLLYIFTQAEIDALEGAVRRSRHIAVEAVTKDDFDHPEIRTLSKKVLNELRDGKGAMVLNGLTQERFTPDELTRIYWGLGMHLGKPVIQNYKRDLLTRVEEEPDKDKPYDTRVKGRGYRNANAAGYHTDTNEIVGLMCIERAETGGESVLTSAEAIHNDFVRNHPELLDPLYEGYYQAIGEDEVMTSNKCPLFGYVDDRLCVYFQVRAMQLAAQKRGETLSDELNQAIAYMYERAAANEAEFTLQAGEMFLWNNRNQLHGRRLFKNSETRKRLLLRLWLEPEHPMRIPDNFPEAFKQKVRVAEHLLT